MPFAGYFSAVNPGTETTVGIDFSNELGVGDAIANASVSMSTFQGTDTDASALLIGSYGLTGNAVYQKIGTAFVGNVGYRLTVTVNTNMGETHIVWGYIICQPVS